MTRETDDEDEVMPMAPRWEIWVAAGIAAVLAIAALVVIWIGG